MSLCSDVCLRLDAPSILEEVDLHRDSSSSKIKTRRRVSALNDRHARIAPYAHDIRLVLYHQNGVLETLKHLCRVSEIEVKCEELRFPDVLDTHGPQHAFFTEKQLGIWNRWLKELPFLVAFQMEALLRHGLLTIEEILKEPMQTELTHLAQAEGEFDPAERLSQLLMHFKEDLRIHDRERGLSAQHFQSARLRFKYSPNQLPPGSFNCCHLTFTPTRVLLEGPFPTQSNRIMRRYYGYEHHFMRVDFRDEDRLTYRWDQHVDGSQFLQDRVGRTLKEGFEIGGKYFEFLAYSSSALREVGSLLLEAAGVHFSCLARGVVHAPIPT
jgi:RNA-dependent RNA polymerase